MNALHPRTEVRRRAHIRTPGRTPQSPSRQGDREQRDEARRRHGSDQLTAALPPLHAPPLLAQEDGSTRRLMRLAKPATLLPTPATSSQFPASEGEAQPQSPRSSPRHPYASKAGRLERRCTTRSPRDGPARGQNARRARRPHPLCSCISGISR